MPAIIKDEKQEAALREITDMLAIVTNINSLLRSKPDFSLIGTKDNAKPVKVDIEDAEKSKVEAILVAYKNRLAKSIESKAKTCRISLSDSELAALK